MNQNKKVLQFVLLATGSLLALSLFVHINKINNPQLQNISIISDIVKQNATTKIATKKIDTALQEIKKDTFTRIDNTAATSSLKHFTTPNRITNFNTDTNAVVIENFIKKLIALRKTKKGKIRIAYLGDSMIEGDLVSQTLRKLLQANFGGSGVGFVPVTSAVAGFRTTVRHTFSTKWYESNFKNKISASPLYLSGKVFFSNGYNWMDIDDKTYTYKATPLKNTCFVATSQAVEKLLSIVFLIALNQPMFLILFYSTVVLNLTLNLRFQMPHCHSMVFRLKPMMVLL